MNEVRVEILKYLDSKQEVVEPFSEAIDEMEKKYNSGNYTFVRLETTGMYGTAIYPHHNQVTFDVIREDINNHEEGRFGVVDKFYTFVFLPKQYEEELRAWSPMYLQDIADYRTYLLDSDLVYVHKISEVQS
jgi:hypothetical protein